MYEKGNEEIRTVSTREAAVICDYHCLANFDGGVDFTLEEELKEIEDVAAPAIHKLDFGETLTTIDEEALAKFIGTCYLRVPNWRQELEKGTEKKLLGEHRNSEFSEDERRAIKNTLFKEMILDSSEILARRLLSIPRHYIRSLIGHRFVTSDNPVVCMNPDTKQYLDYSVNILKEDFELTFPVSSRIVLFACARAENLRIQDHDPRLIREINKQTVAASNRYVYAPFNDPSFNRTVVQEYIHTSPKFE